MTVTVNIGGDSRAWQAIVTGTQVSGLIITGTEQHGSPATCTPPIGSTFQYFSLEPARYGTITGAEINFTVPQSWLDTNHIDPRSIVLYHLTPDCWQPLPTAFLSTRDGTPYFSARTPGLSRFAIAGTPSPVNTGAPVTPATTRAATIRPVAVRKTTAPAYAPAAVQTTIPPAREPVPEPGFPFLTALFLAAGCLVLIGGGMYVRRWWIRRQNPALFREYD